MRISKTAFNKLGKKIFNEARLSYFRKGMKVINFHEEFYLSTFLFKQDQNEPFAHISMGHFGLQVDLDGNARSRWNIKTRSFSQDKRQAIISRATRFSSTC